jgi:methyl coenzyme M reductase beta subunit
MGTVIYRLQSRSFIQAVAERAKRNEIVELLNVDEDARLKLEPTRNGDSLVISIVDDSADLVQVSINAVVAELVAKHDAIINYHESDIRKEILRLDSEINTLSKHLDTMLDGKIKVLASPKPSEGLGLGTGFLLMSTQSILENRLNRSSLLRESVSSANVRPTTTIEPPSVSEQRIFSKLWRACLFGILTGIFLSAIYVKRKK